MATPANDEFPMPSDATRNMFLVAAGFGIGALVVMVGFGVVLGLGGVEHGSPAAAPTVQTSAATPAAPQQPAANASAPSAPATTGQAQPPQPTQAQPKQQPAPARSK